MATGYFSTAQKFQAQAQGRMKEEDEEREDGEATPVWDCGSPLYDSFELVSLSHILDRNLMALPNSGGPGRLNGRSSNAEDGISLRFEAGPTKKDRGFRKVDLFGGRMGKSKGGDGEKRKEKMKKIKARFHGFRKVFSFWRK